MRLKSIKLAGFKSFVDPTTVSFPTNLSAVVGPNGCGKSNIIDAVRWVMGESSAKQLRGESMTDVIFNGSGGRKPVGQASIELVFDNSDGTVVGEFAGYSEISVKRKVTRDSVNSYYLNGTKCRRKDITDIFLGTGLGPRSYAIIEQGMISKLVEAKPDELRVTIEEAAGISKYKERRRDTENRINRTFENLERLTDIREELERQIARLERQSKAAEKYTEYKKEERWLKAQQLTLEIRDLESRAKSNKDQITELELKIEALVTEQVGKDTEIEKLRTQHVDLNDTFNEVQGRYYAAGSDIARIEQMIQNAEERSQQLQTDLGHTQQDLRETEENLTQDKDKTEAWEVELLEIEPELNSIKSAESVSTEVLLEAEEKMQTWQSEWDSFNQQAATPQQNAEVQQSRIQHIEQVQTRLLERIAKFEQEKGDAGIEIADDNLDELEAKIAEIEEAVEAKREQLNELAETVNSVRENLRTNQSSLDSKRSELQKLQGQHASLETLQQAALGQSNKSVSNWLDSQGLSNNSRLAQSIQVDSGWDLAVETVLNDSLQAVCVDGLDPFSNLLNTLEKGELILIDKAIANSSNRNAAPTLLSKVTSDYNVAGLIDGIYAVDDIVAALQLRSNLSAGESVVTKDGIWLGPNWLRVSKGKDAQQGILERQQTIESLVENIAQVEQVIQELEEGLDSKRESLKDSEQQQVQMRQVIDEENKKLSSLSSELSAKKVRIEESRNRQQRVMQELLEANQQMSTEAENLSQARMILSEAIEAMEANNIERETLMSRRDEFRGTLDQARQKARHDKDRSHELAMRYQSVQTQLESIRQSLSRLEQQSQRLVERRESLQMSLEELKEPLAENRVQLETLLEKRVGVESELAEARRSMESVDHDLRQSEQGRHQAESQIQSVREILEKARIEAQTYHVQRQNNEDKLRQEEFSYDEVIAALPDDANVKAIGEELEQIANRISRLGAINLAAIDEYQVELERKTYLDAQNEDLQEALTTLQDAIRKIDQETRNRFKETFEKVNAGLQELFPRVFGGGSAYLELTGDDMLDTGIAIMARPPGKRNSTIHLLSGGEKALTAIALVFSIFRLNPAPFCMLDEVDAPLDDVNVGRYAQLVNDMSETVQFIFITHNKIPMEIANQLMGVTMHEPGVSRLVTVDVEEAAQLASA
ncbi:MAG: chromosome segregation protein SMC [Cellvibrionaceae bacterium]